MARVHAFEFEDLTWFPAALRDMMTEYLQHTARIAGSFAGYAAARLVEPLRAQNCREIVDLGSGSGGILPDVVARLDEQHGWPVHATLTDRFPNLTALEKAAKSSSRRLDFVAEPVDATAVPPHLDGMRTLFLSFHHFRPDTARAILADAARRGRSIAVFEATERHPLAIAGFMLFILPLVLLVTPFVRPFRWSRILFTYLVPILPLLIAWDGLVSHLRTYSTDELEALCATIDVPGYRWDVRRERLPGGPQRCISLVGTPAGG